MKLDKDEIELAETLLERQVGNRNGKIITIKPIHKGYTNVSYMVVYQNGATYQVRFPHCGDLINRLNELEVLNLINDKTFIYFERNTGIAIKKWIKGKCPIIPTWWKWRHVDQLFSEIKKIHATKIPETSQLKELNFEAYNANLYRLRIAYQAKYLSIIDKYDNDELVLNHTDINAENLIIDSSKKLHLIDYEWCAKANDYWDYANFIRESNIKFNKIDWNKYIPNFDMLKLKEMIFAASVYAYLWTWAMPDSPKIRKYRVKTVKQIHRYARGVVGNEE